MKLQYLGTAAAEAWPALFCECESCKKARAAGGRNIRTRSQALIDDRLLIDFPADTYFHCIRHGVDITRIENMIVTHAHSDHWYPADLWCRYPGIAHFDGESCPLTVWGTAAIRDSVEEHLPGANANGEDRLRYREIEPFGSYEIGGYTVTALPANHDPHAQPVIYQISDGEKTMLYGNDTGIPFESVWQYWEQHPVRFDYVSLDCTGVLQPGWRDGHMSLESNAEVLERMRGMGLVDEKTTVCIHHFSHNGGLIHDELEEYVKPQGWLVSYDGMTVEF